MRGVTSSRLNHPSVRRLDRPCIDSVERSNPVNMHLGDLDQVLHGVPLDSLAPRGVVSKPEEWRMSLLEGRNSASFSKTWSHKCCCVPINLEAEAMAITTGGANMKLRTRRPTPWSRLPALSHKPGHLYVFASTGTGEFDYQDCRETQECIEASLYDLYCFKPRQE